VKETLNNIVRHYEATKVEVDLAGEAGEVVLQVHDNGRGISSQEVHGRQTLGLRGMRERALGWGGTISFVGSAEKGTVVTVWIPLGRHHA